eukprot:TRINITY_DN13468_c0_g1_i15.p1 TRINITY_DN13468_c0_g1~~TRINITY_DN13468_c0_g1_i15.p1  ORF type:complete len:194 (-),score=-8.91 TRINITY_DN13468_c0_g1_i15:345-926(-)
MNLSEQTSKQTSCKYLHCCCKILLLFQQTRVKQQIIIITLLFCIFKKLIFVQQFIKNIDVLITKFRVEKFVYQQSHFIFLKDLGIQQCVGRDGKSRKINCCYNTFDILLGCYLTSQNMSASGNFCNNMKRLRVKKQFSYINKKLRLKITGNNMKRLRVKKQFSHILIKNYDQKLRLKELVSGLFCYLFHAKQI